MFKGELELEAELEDLMSILAESDLESEAGGVSGWFQTAGRIFREPGIVADQMAAGVRDENKLTDAVFFDRYPAQRGKPLRNDQVALRQEWISIRDSLVRPMLLNPPAVQPPASAPAAPPAAPAPAAPAPVQPPAETFGNSIFYYTSQYAPDQYVPALTAQAAYQKVSGFQPYYNRISSAAPRVNISPGSVGVGNLVFSIDQDTFGRLVESEELRDKAVEIMTHGAVTKWISSHLDPSAGLEFTEQVIGILGIGLTMLDIARGLENERMVGGFGPDRDQWIQKQQLQFVFGLIAEDISRNNWGNGYFFSRNVRDLAVEVAQRYAEFRPIFSNYAPYFWQESDFAKFGPNPPPPQTTMGPA
jgi:hypothetical protein